MIENRKKVYDVIVIGSGNGACGFLSHYIQQKTGQRIAVVEEGDDFFNTSYITHQRNWTQSYAEDDIFKLHKATTLDGVPIISGRACTMGGGGSINYTMIHESSEWLTTNIGKTVAYWEDLKKELNEKFAREDPSKTQSVITKHILDMARKCEFEDSTNITCNIPDYKEGKAKLLHQFPTQFDQFGQRTHSGVSLVDWSCVDLKTQCKVTKIEFETDDATSKERCVSVVMNNLKTGELESLYLSQYGKLILCAGSATPNLLYAHKELLQNNAIGEHVSDHILFPLGVYILPKEVAKNILPQDVYVPVFATTICKLDMQEQSTVCCFDFFAGNFEKLWFFIAHLYLAFLLPNFLKKLVISRPWLFSKIKCTVMKFVKKINGVFKFEQINLVTAIVKFTPSTDGAYINNGDDITLGFFAQDGNDEKVAKKVIEENLEFVNKLGDQPHPIFKWIFRYFTKIPYEKKQVKDYVDIYSKNFLLSEQHLSGGCLFGKAIDSGAITQTDTGKLNGSSNVYVADLSTVPLPRISPQMTAYLIGYHVAKMLCSDR
ncbi:GMC oxidoreductase [Pseudanabaena minima]|uniref:GMC oxidoreductase n=1 Tax=Pseudanabaena minima TaxID=890415 RepID=UPI003DA7E70D